MLQIFKLNHLYTQKFFKWLTDKFIVIRWEFEYHLPKKKKSKFSKNEVSLFQNETKKFAEHQGNLLIFM